MGSLPLSCRRRRCGCPASWAPVALAAAGLALGAWLLSGGSAGRDNTALSDHARLLPRGRSPGRPLDVQRDGQQQTRDATTPALAVVLSDFEPWENRVPAAADAWLRTRDSAGVATVVALSERGHPYPPLFPAGKPPPPGVAVVASRPGPDSVAPPLDSAALRAECVNAGGRAVADAVGNADAVVLTTDSSVLHGSPVAVRAAAASAVRRGEVGLVVMADTAAHACSHAEFDVRRWTVTLSPASAASTRPCNYVEGEAGATAAVVVPTTLLSRLGDWHTLRPLSEGVLLAALSLGVRVDATVAPLATAGASTPPSLYATPHNAAKRQRTVAIRRQELYAGIGVKLKRWEGDNGVGRDEWHGCARSSARCFGTVYNDTPEFLAGGRWTPPCCLEKLRETARYVFAALDAAGVRWWLEGGSLLGAARSGDIIPWDYDVDVGVNRDDLAKCPELAALREAPYRVSPEGFVWERAREGEFFRVQYSATNHLHVDIFPFHEDANGMMLKGKWGTGHRQDTAFPASLLGKLSRVPFAGANASAAANPRAFLEYKFGPGVIESPLH